MGAFLDLAAELTGTLPGLSPALAESYVTRAWYDICRERRWSFLLADALLVCPAQLTAGTIAVTHGAATATCNATATTTLTGLTDPVLTLRQIRCAGGPLYGITVAAGSPLVLTLDRPYQEITAAAATYQVYRAWVGQPSTDFLTWDTLDDPANGLTLSGPSITRNRLDFDRRDPQRSSQGIAAELGHYRGDPLWELWPHPTDGQTFLASYRTRGVTPDYTDPASGPPDLIPDALILSRALGWYGYPWAHANKGSHTRYQKTDLLTLLVDTKRTYQGDLLKAKKHDDEHALQTVYNRGWRGRTRPSGVVGDARYWQAHPIHW